MMNHKGNASVSLAAVTKGLCGQSMFGGIYRYGGEGPSIISGSLFI